MLEARMRCVIVLVEDVADKIAGWHIAAMSVRRGQPRVHTFVCGGLQLTYVRSYKFPLSIMYIVYRIGI